MAPMSCKISSAAIVSERMRDSANATSSAIFLSKWWHTIYVWIYIYIYIDIVSYISLYISGQDHLSISRIHIDIYITKRTRIDRNMNSIVNIVIVRGFAFRIYIWPYHTYFLNANYLYISIVIRKHHQKTVWCCDTCVSTVFYFSIIRFHSRKKYRYLSQSNDDWIRLSKHFISISINLPVSFHVRPYIYIYLYIYIPACPHVLQSCWS